MAKKRQKKKCQLFEKWLPVYTQCGHLLMQTLVSSENSLESLWQRFEKDKPAQQLMSLVQTVW